MHGSAVKCPFTHAYICLATFCVACAFVTLSTFASVGAPIIHMAENGLRSNFVVVKKLCYWISAL